MSSLNQLISEIISITGTPNNVPVRRNIKYAILHTRNELIRQSYGNHRYVDKGLEQRFRISIIDVPDGDLFDTDNLGLPVRKRTTFKVPKPVRLDNNLPFQSVRTAGYNGKEIAFVREPSAKYYKHLPGFCSQPCYDYINGYIYIFGDADYIPALGAIIIESPFEMPHLIPEETVESFKDISEYDPIDNETIYDDDEFLLPEDMVEQIKTLIVERNVLNSVRETNETPKRNLIK